MFRSYLLLAALAAVSFAQQSNKGWYSSPAIHGDTIAFTSEGDLWQVGLNGGLARRLTTHPGYETNPVFSPNGDTIAFVADYEGPSEIYTMPATGGLPVRRTFQGGDVGKVSGWTPDGRILYSTRSFSGFPIPASPPSMRITRLSRYRSTRLHRALTMPPAIHCFLPDSIRSPVRLNAIKAGASRTSGNTQQVPKRFP